MRWMLSYGGCHSDEAKATCAELELHTCIIMIDDAIVTKLSYMYMYRHGTPTH